MTDHINIQKTGGKWVVRAGGAVLGESEQALELCEGDLTPVIYFPRGDIAMAFFERSESSSHCPHKGDASYYTLHAKSGEIADAAWSYEAPLAAVAQIKGYLAFYADKVTVEQL